MSDITRIAFIDLETIGLPKTISFDRYHPYEETKYYDSARIVQIAIVVCDIDKSKLADLDGLSTRSYIESKNNAVVSALNILDKLPVDYPFIKVIATHDYIIKPDGFVIRNAAIHDITQSLACFSGLPFADAIALIEPDLAECTMLIAHNILFDKNVLLSELHRYGKANTIKTICSMKEFCTSKGCETITKIRYNRTQYKQPKLTELYHFLFKKHPENLHNALMDVAITITCFAELLAKKYLSLD